MLFSCGKRIVDEMRMRECGWKGRGLCTKYIYIFIDPNAEMKDRTQKMTHVGLLMECKLYIEMLREIEEVGRKNEWKSPLLQGIREILYRESPKFKVVT